MRFTSSAASRKCLVSPAAQPLPDHRARLTPGRTAPAASRCRWADADGRRGQRASARSTSARSSAARRARRARRVEWLAQRLGVDADFLAERRLDRRAHAHRDAARPGRGAVRGAEYLEAIEHDRGHQDRRPRVGLARARAADAPRRGVGAAGPSARSARRSSCSPARARSPRRRSSRTSIAPTSLFRLGVCRYKLSSIATAVALFDEAIAARRALGSAVRPPPLEDSRLALALPPPPARLRGSARGRRARPRARRRPRRPADDRARLLPGVADRRARRPLGQRAPVRRARARRCTRRSTTSSTSAGCSTTSAASTSCSASPTTPCSTSRTPSRVLDRRRWTLGRGRQRGLVARACPARPGDSRPPRSRRVTRSRSSTTTRIASARSATRSSCSVARCSSRAGSTNVPIASVPPKRRSTSSSRPVIAPLSGSPRAISQRAATTTRRLPACTGALQRPCRTSGSNDERRCSHDKDTLDLHCGAAARRRCSR